MSKNSIQVKFRTTCRGCDGHGETDHPVLEGYNKNRMGVTTLKEYCEKISIPYKGSYHSPIPCGQCDETGWIEGWLMQDELIDILSKAVKQYLEELQEND